jgi:hypothetical protein
VKNRASKTCRCIETYFTKRHFDDDACSRSALIKRSLVCSLEPVAVSS